MVNIIAIIVREDCEIMWLVRGKSNNEFKERLANKGLRFTSGRPDLEVQACILMVDRN
jgi:hypothetical protein